MTSATSLRASADAFDSIGREFDAATCRRFARQSEALPAPLPEELYRNWATQMAERATDKLQQFNAKDVA